MKFSTVLLGLGLGSGLAFGQSSGKCTQWTIEDVRALYECATIDDNLNITNPGDPATCTAPTYRTNVRYNNWYKLIEPCRNLSGADPAILEANADLLSKGIILEYNYRAIYNPNEGDLYAYYALIREQIHMQFAALFLGPVDAQKFVTKLRATVGLDANNQPLKFVDPATGEVCDSETACLLAFDRTVAWRDYTSTFGRLQDFFQKSLSRINVKNDDEKTVFQSLKLGQETAEILSVLYRLGSQRILDPKYGNDLIGFPQRDNDALLLWFNGFREAVSTISFRYFDLGVGIFLLPAGVRSDVCPKGCHLTVAPVTRQLGIVASLISLQNNQVISRASNMVVRVSDDFRELELQGFQPQSVVSADQASGAIRLKFSKDQPGVLKLNWLTPFTPGAPPQDLTLRLLDSALGARDLNQFVPEGSWSSQDDILGRWEGRIYLGGKVVPIAFNFCRIDPPVAPQITYTSQIFYDFNAESPAGDWRVATEGVFFKRNAARVLVTIDNGVLGLNFYHLAMTSPDILEGQFVRSRDAKGGKVELSKVRSGCR